jgi:hypothetical protein
MQKEFCSRGEMEVLGGGAAGPGKTDCLIAMALRNVWHPKYRGLLLRRTNPRAQEILDRTHDLYPRAVLGAEWREGKRRWMFPTGATIMIGHMQHEEDKRNYHGQEFHFIGWDELTEFTESQYLFVSFSRRRRTVDLPFRTLIRATTNPGGPGHSWVKNRFRIGTVEPGQAIREDMVLPDGEVITTTRAFVPGRLSDNPSINQNEYIASLMHLPEVERMRLLEGIWDVFEGQAFRELSMDVHGFDYDCPNEWETYSVFDWGYAKPSAYYIVRVDPDGRLWLEHEKYWRREQTEDDGVRKTASEIGREIAQLEIEWKVNPTVRLADPACWAPLPKFRQGESMGRSVMDDFNAAGLYFLKANNERIHGRQQIHHRLTLDEEQRPHLQIHTRQCPVLWETLPLMRESEHNPEDLVTKDMPDHGYDCLRYACMHRQMRRTKKVVRPEEQPGTFQYERARLKKARRIAGTRGIALEEAYKQVR